MTWRLDAPDSTAMLTPRRSLSSLASLQLKGLYGDFDAALPRPAVRYWERLTLRSSTPRAASKSPYRSLSCGDANEDKLRRGVDMAVLSGAPSRQVTLTWAETGVDLAGGEP